MPRRGVEASIRSTAYTNAIATRPALPPLPARVLPNALLLVPFPLLASTGSPTRTVHAPSSVGGVYATAIFEVLYAVTLLTRSLYRNVRSIFYKCT